jgi:DNA-binding NtrC family response regulator
VALEQFDPHDIDLLLLDIDLPGCSGWEVFGDFTARRPTLPVVVITGHAGQQPTAQAAGVDAFMEKPLDAVKLLQTIRVVLATPDAERSRWLQNREGRLRHQPATARMIFEELREWPGLPLARVAPSGPVVAQGTPDIQPHQRQN